MATRKEKDYNFSSEEIDSIFSILENLKDGKLMQIIESSTSKYQKKIWAWRKVAKVFRKKTGRNVDAKALNNNYDIFKKQRILREKK